MAKTAETECCSDENVLIEKMISELESLKKIASRNVAFKTERESTEFFGKFETLAQGLIRMKINDVLEKRRDPAEYQTSQNGKVFVLSDLSRADLMQVAAEEMNFLEDMDSMVTDMQAKLEDWRHGRKM